MKLIDSETVAILDYEDQIIDDVYKDVRELIYKSKNRACYAVNTELVYLYWNIGNRIFEIQGRKIRAKYRNYVIEGISKKLTLEFGDGYSYRNLRNMRQFYILFPIWQTVSAKLSWSHYIELIHINEELKRDFYMQESINSGWSVRELQRQIHSLLYERLAVSKN